nr:DNA polymerase III subunit chi [Pseudomonas sp.]
MTSIHFSFNAADRLQTACLISARRYQAGDSLGVYCRDTQRLAVFDRLLWDYERAAFVPHVMEHDPLAFETPIVLYTTKPDARHGWVLNLDDDCVPEAASFANIIEVVASSDAERAGGRARWRTYQAAGHTIVQHDAARNDLP